MLAAEAHQLADVREPPLAAGHREHPQVVAAELERAFDQLLDTDSGDQLALAREPIRERRQQRTVSWIEVVEQRPRLAQHPPRVTPRFTRGGGDHDERIDRDRDQRRGEHGV